MTPRPEPSARPSALAIPRSPFLLWLNLCVALAVATIGFGLGFYQGLQAQLVILYTLVTAAVLFWVANYVAVGFEVRAAQIAADAKVERSPEERSAWATNRVLIIAMAALLVAYLIVAASVPGFRTVGNLVAFLVLEAILVFAFKVSARFEHGRSAFIGLIVLVALIVVSSFTIDGFLSGANVKAILLFSAFLGIACIGQTLVALMGGLDLSIPFVIGASNIGLLYIIGLGVPSWVAVIVIIVIGGAIGFLNGLLSFKLQARP